MVWETDPKSKINQAAQEGPTRYNHWTSEIEQTRKGLNLFQNNFIAS